MSTTSFFYHTFGTINYQHIRTEYKDKIYVHMKKKNGKQYCTKCKSYKVTHKDKKVRKIQTLPIGRKIVILVLHLHRLKCKDCGTIRLEAIEIGDPKKHYSKKLAMWVLDLLKTSTIQDVANTSGLSWDQVKDIEKTYLKKKYEKVKVKDLEYISIDEFYIGKKQKYFTFVSDLKTGRIVFVAQGKDGACLASFFKKLKRSKVEIKAASIDMGKAYIAAMLENLPKTPIVFDHFHVVKLINRKLDEFRRQAVAEAKRLGIPSQKGLRWTILKNPENLTDKQQTILDQLLQLNTPLTQVYLLKEQFRSFWTFKSKKKAQKFLDNWLIGLRSIGSRLMNTLANTIKAYSFGLFNYFDHHISSGMMEGLNNKVATMIKQSYGFRDMEYFKLKVKSIHESRHALVG